MYVGSTFQGLSSTIFLHLKLYRILLLGIFSSSKAIECSLYILDGSSTREIALQNNLLKIKVSCFVLMRRKMKLKGKRGNFMSKKSNSKGKGKVEIRVD